MLETLILCTLGFLPGVIAVGLIMIYVVNRSVRKWVLR